MLTGCARAVLQECGLKTYLFSYGSYYSSLSLQQLSQMFELPEMKVRSLNFCFAVIWSCHPNAIQQYPVKPADCCTLKLNLACIL